MRWEQALARQGWLAYTWPAEHGGPGWSVLQQYLFEQVLAEMDAPTVIPFGMKMVGPVLLRFGTEAQQREHLPGVLNATRWWCQGATRAGAALTWQRLDPRRARRRGDYVVNGQKILDLHRTVGRLDVRAGAHQPREPAARTASPSC